MEFTEAHAKSLLAKEWLAKSNSASSTPYLFKFDCSKADLLCCIMITDMKSVWTEVLSSQHLARRWRSNNPLSPDPFLKTTEEDSWRLQILELLSKAHTLGGITELSFEIVESRCSDLSFELECEAFKWRWETDFLGHKWSSEIISKHLVFPLISLNHLTFSSTEAFGELPDIEIEKAVDKIGRTARRTVDTHIKNALSKPRLATTLRRMTAIFNFVPDFPPVTSKSETPQLQLEQDETERTIPSPKLAEQSREKISDNPLSSVPERHSDKHERSVPPSTKPDQSDSATESDADDPMNISRPGSLENVADPSKTVIPEFTAPQPHRSQTPPGFSKPPVESTSDSESSPYRPMKKAKPAKARHSSDEDDGAGRKNRVAQPKNDTTGGAAKTRGTRQPIKRGGKRF